MKAVKIKSSLGEWEMSEGIMGWMKRVPSHTRVGFLGNGVVVDPLTPSHVPVHKGRILMEQKLSFNPSHHSEIVQRSPRLEKSPLRIRDREE